MWQLIGWLGVSRYTKVISKNNMLNKKTNYKSERKFRVRTWTASYALSQDTKVSSNNISSNMRFIKNNWTMKQISRYPIAIDHRHNSQWQAYSLNLEGGR